MKIREALFRLLAPIRKRRLDRELENEVLAHIEMAERDYLAAGMSPSEARDAARRNFGGIEQMKEVHRDRRGFRWIENLFMDFRYGLASLRREPGFAAVAVGVLALGIGANAAVFSLVDAVFLKPLPFSEPERIVWVWEAPSATTRNQTSTLTFLDWKKLDDVFEALSVEQPVTAALSGNGDPFRLAGKLVSADYFRVFGVNAFIGRTFAPKEDQPGSAPVVVLSHAAWQTRFGSDPGILGRDLILDGAPNRVIGVLPKGAFDRDEAAFWKPLVFAPDQVNRGPHWLQVVGRLKPGVSLEQARAKLRILRASLAPLMAPWKKDWTFAVEPLAAPFVGNALRRSIYIAFGAVLMVLLTACANVANLLLARGAARSREIAVRASLGASRGRIIAQLLTESLVLALSGAAAGVALAYVLIHAALPPLRPLLPPAADVTLDIRVLAFAAATAVVVSLLIGLVPALRIPLVTLTQSLNHGARGSSAAGSGLRRTIVAVEVAVSLVLLSGALLLSRSLLNLQRADPGVRMRNIVTAPVDLPLAAYPRPDSAVRFYDAVVERLQAVPGVERASVSQDLPLEGVRGGELFFLPGYEPLVVRYKRVDANYFRTFEIPLEAGRGISERDRADAPRVVVINRTLARLLAGRFKVPQPVGRSVRISTPGYGTKPGPAPPATQIVGVIRDERTGELQALQQPVAYVPLAQVPREDIRLVVSARGDPAAVTSGIREAVREIDPHLALAEVRTMEQVKERTLTWARQPAWVIGAFAAVAALLAALGLYGVLAYSITQRQREIGIRMALGARAGDVLTQILRSALAILVVGLAIGFGGAFALTRFLRSLLFGVSPLDPLVLAAACLAMTVVGIAAAWAPAIRAARVDPAVALREG